MFSISKQIKIIKEDPKFLRKTLTIAIPIALQTLLSTVLNMIDTVMIVSLGESTISAVGLANKYFFVFSLLAFGIVSGASILTSQYWGKRDEKNIKRVLGMSLLISLIAAIAFMIPALFAPEFVMKIFTPNSSTIQIGAMYLSVIALSYPITAMTNCYVSLLRSVNMVKAPVTISVASIIVNIILNYVLIFGKFGAPQLGVTGAALATLIARIIEFLALIILVYAKRTPAAAKWKELINFDKEFFKHFLTHVTPVIANEFMWGLGVTMYSLAYGRMGDAATAAITITQTVEQFFLVIFQGLGAAATVIIGNELGANRLKKSDEYAKSFLFLSFLLGIVMLVFCVVTRNSIVTIFDVTPQVSDYIKKCLLIFAFYIPVKMFNYVNIVGILRSGGDTKATLLLDTTGVWFIGIPMAFLGGLVFHLPIYIVYGLVLVEEVYKMILGFARYKKKKWLRNIVNVVEG